jgi:hypothetical protein
MHFKHKASPVASYILNVFFFDKIPFVCIKQDVDPRIKTPQRSTFKQNSKI